jgi:hypothetical protein
VLAGLAPFEVREGESVPGRTLYSRVTLCLVTCTMTLVPLRSLAEVLRIRTPTYKFGGAQSNPEQASEEGAHAHSGSLSRLFTQP